MKKNKVLALAVAVSTMSMAFVNTTLVSANSEITKGYDLVYNLEKSSETTRAVDVYVNGYTGISSLNIQLDITGGVVLNDAMTDPMTDWSVDYPQDMNLTYFYDAGDAAFYSCAANNGSIAYKDKIFNGGFVGTLIFNVANADASFDVSVAPSYADINGEYPEQLDTLTVPAYVAGGGKVEVTADGAHYSDFADDPVYACVAESVGIDAIKNKTLTWNIKAGEKVVGTKLVNIETDLSGFAEVVFGLVLVNDNDQANFETISSAVLVIE